MNRENEDQGFRSIGSLLPKIENLRPGSDSTGEPSSPSSEITGSGLPARRGQSLTGPRRGGTDVAKSDRTEQAISQSDQALAALLTQCAGSISWRRIDESGDYGYERSIDVPQARNVEQRYRDAYEAACVPMGLEETNRLLGKLKVMTAARQQQADDIAFQIMVYAEELAEYPADIARHVLSTQYKVSKWWPAWQEIQSRIEHHGRQRMALAV